MKKLTQAEKQRQRIDNVRKLYCQRYGIDDFEFKENIFRTGLEWLKANKLESSLSYSKTFWSWWEITLTNCFAVGLESKEKMEQINIVDYFPPSSVFKQIKQEVKKAKSNSYETER